MDQNPENNNDNSDDNKNKKWDAGNYLQKTQSEEVLYFPKELDVRANWDVEQVFDLKNTN